MRKLVITFLIFIAGWGLGSARTEGQSQGELPCVRKLIVPSYPLLARQARINGDVSAVVRVNPSGSVISVSEVRGDPLLAYAVEAALKEWTFGGSTVSTIPLVFRFSFEGEARDDRLETKVFAALPQFIEIKINPPKPLGPDYEYVPDEPRKKKRN
jgi:hypothetical protein